MILTWDELKQEGSTYYKTGGIQPIDLYVAKGSFEGTATDNIIKYAFRIVSKPLESKFSDCDKIIHYAELLKAYYEKKLKERQDSKMNLSVLNRPYQPRSTNEEVKGSMTTKTYKIKPTKKQLALIKGYWRMFRSEQLNFYHRIEEMESRMRKATGIKDIEFIHDSGCLGWFGVGNAERTMKLIQFK